MKIEKDADPDERVDQLIEEISGDWPLDGELGSRDLDQSGRDDRDPDEVRPEYDFSGATRGLFYRGGVPESVGVPAGAAAPGAAEAMLDLMRKVSEWSGQNGFDDDQDPALDSSAQRVVRALDRWRALSGVPAGGLIGGPIAFGAVGPNPSLSSGVHVHLDAIELSCRDSIARAGSTVPRVVISADVLLAVTSYARAIGSCISKLKISRIDDDWLRVESAIDKIVEFAGRGPIVGGPGADDADGEVVEVFVDLRAQLAAVDRALSVEHDPSSRIEAIGRLIETDEQPDKVDDDNVDLGDAFRRLDRSVLVNVVGPMHYREALELARDALLDPSENLRGEVFATISSMLDGDLGSSGVVNPAVAEYPVDRSSSSDDRQPLVSWPPHTGCDPGVISLDPDSLTRAAEVSAREEDDLAVEQVRRGVAAQVEICARAHGDRARDLDRWGSSAGAAELRRVENLLWALARGDHWSVVLDAARTTSCATCSGVGYFTGPGPDRQICVACIDGRVPIIGGMVPLCGPSGWGAMTARGDRDPGSDSAEERWRDHAQTCESDVRRRVSDAVEAAAIYSERKVELRIADWLESGSSRLVLEDSSVASAIARAIRSGSWSGSAPSPAGSSCGDLVPFVDGELDRMRAFRFRAHLGLCDPCRRGVLEAVRMSSRLGALSDVPPVVLGPDGEGVKANEDKSESEVSLSDVYLEIEIARGVVAREGSGGAVLALVDGALSLLRKSLELIRRLDR